MVHIVHASTDSHNRSPGFSSRTNRIGKPGRTTKMSETGWRFRGERPRCRDGRGSKLRPPAAYATPRTSSHQSVPYGGTRSAVGVRATARRGCSRRDCVLGLVAAPDVASGHTTGQDEPVLGLEMVVLLGVALVACGALARRYPIAPAILLVLVGVLVGFVPHLRQAQLPPEVVLLVFLPALLYWESLTTSLREIRNNLRVVVLTSTALVAATAAAVAAAAHGLGLAWGPAWVLGAALAPTDATAVGVLAGHLPRRTVTVLRAESLVNDGTALVLYGLAVGVTVGEQQLTGWHVTWLLVWSYVGGVLAGALIGLLSWQVRRRMDDPMLESIAMLVTPFAAFLLADAAHASGVLAVVA